jgi:hypothetical protein
MTYFDSVKLVVIAKVVELHKAGKLGSKSNLEIAQDIHGAVLR